MDHSILVGSQVIGTAAELRNDAGNGDKGGERRIARPGYLAPCGGKDGFSALNWLMKRSRPQRGSKREG
jgi:hypothetical protein